MRWREYKANSMTNNILRPFIIGSKNIRGKIVKLDQALDQVLTSHDYNDAISKILGEALLAISLIGSDMKSGGILTLQFQSEGDIRIFVADVTGDLHIRGYVEYNDNIDFTNKNNAKDLFDKGYLVVTIDPADSNQRYQGIVEIKGDTISEMLTNYIVTSEQIETVIKVAVNKIDGKWVGGGLILQKLPSNEEEDLKLWEDAEVFANSVKDEELLSNEIDDLSLLKRLFGMHDVIAFDQRVVEAKCRCSHLKALKLLQTLDKEELETLKVDGKLIVKCQYCNKTNEFTHI